VRLRGRTARGANGSGCKRVGRYAGFCPLPCDSGTVISLGTTLPQPSSGLPGNSGGPVTRSLSDLAPSEVYPASPITRAPGGLLHHRFTLTADPKAGGGLLSVALSRGSLRVGVTHRPALWCPDVPRHPAAFRRTLCRTTRPSGRPVCPSRVPRAERTTASCPSTRWPAGRHVSCPTAGSTRRRPGCRPAGRAPRRRDPPCRDA
jgi:hypothetical protein